MYRHDGLTVAANYDYSQRSHDGPWRRGVGSDTRFVVRRNDFTLIAEGGQTIRLASQAQGEADPNGINLLLQNSVIHRRNLDGTYRLALDNASAKAALPNQLQ